MDGFAHVTTVRELESGLRVSRRGAVSFGLGAPSWLMLAHFSQFFAFFSILGGMLV